MVVRLILGLVALLLSIPVHADMVGNPRVIDGDTVEIAGEKIRLLGIDAPEARQYCKIKTTEYPCGVMATAWLVKKTMDKTIRCLGNERDRYGRIIATCHVDGANLNAEIVRAGWALAYRQYSLDYIGDEATAKDARIGIWRGQFVSPWEWRQGTRLAGKATKKGQSSDCMIKGNISRRGERIYHLPGGVYYNRTKIDRSKGERMFCTEGEAQEAGWRSSKR